MSLKALEQPQTAGVYLGEEEMMKVSEATPDARAETLALLGRRAPDATICPSEVARVLAGASPADWRDAMPAVHAAVDRLVDEGVVSLSWKGKPLTARAGPYRISATRS